MPSWYLQWNRYAPGVVGAVKVEMPPLPDTRTSNALFVSATKLCAFSSSLTTVTCWPGRTGAGTLNANLEMTMSARGGAGVAVGADIDVIAGADDDDWSLPPHAVRRLRKPRVTRSQGSGSSLVWPSSRTGRSDGSQAISSTARARCTRFGGPARQPKSPPECRPVLIASAQYGHELRPYPPARRVGH